MEWGEVLRIIEPAERTVKKGGRRMSLYSDWTRHPGSERVERMGWYQGLVTWSE